jgi:hypothetical protein
LWKALRDNRLKKPADHFVGCGEARSASVREMMRFTMFTTSYGLFSTVSDSDLRAMGFPDDWRGREPWVGAE